MKTKNKPNGWYTGIVHIWDLPQDEVYVDLKKEFKYKLLFGAKGKNPWSNFTKFHRIHQDILLSYKYRQRVSLKIIWKLLKLANKNGIKITKEEIEKNITKIGGHQRFIENPNLPFKFNSPEGTKFIAAILHDGGVRTRNSPFYSNYVISKRKEISTTANKIFGKIKVSFKTKSIEFPIIIGIILTRGIGLKRGNKVVSNPKIPEFIFNLENKSISSYLRQAYDDDGFVVKGKRNNHKMVGITCNTGHISDPPKPNLLIDIKRLLDKLGIPTQRTIKKSKSKFSQKKNYLSQEWKLLITGLYSLSKFQEGVDFGLDYKNKNLTFIIKKLRKDSKKPQNPNNLSEKLALEVCRRKRVVDKYILASETNFSPLWSRALLNKLVNKGYLQKLEKANYNDSNIFIYKGDKN